MTDPGSDEHTKIVEYSRVYTLYEKTNNRFNDPSIVNESRKPLF